MKLIVALITGLILNQAFAFKMTDKYVIFEPGDKEVESFIAYLKRTYSQMGLTPLERNDFTEELFERLDEINTAIHQAYLSHFNITAEEFPKPYVVIDRGRNSANYGVPMPDQVTQQTVTMGTNFITISFEHIKNEKALWTVLAHEIAHYYHNHIQEKNFLRASYTHHRELNEANGYGANIENDMRLAQALESIYMTSNAYVGRGANVDSITSMKIGTADPMLNLIVKQYSNVFTYDKTESMADLSCYGLKNRITKLAGREALTLQAIEDIDKLAKVCPATKFATHLEIVEKIYPMDVAYKVVQNPRQFTTDRDSNKRVIAEGILQEEHALATAFKIILNYRTELKNLVEAIQWDKLQFYTKENEADITSFKVLNAMGLAHYQISFLDLVFNKNKCVESLENEAVEVNYFSHTELDTHNSMCWRVYRSRQMLEGINKVNQNILH
ncbi:MAG: hypothetical protein CME62_12315 [Halobacteriovoraceae bacterium]|nr:hypothetical protein [Halobacteriovoraceae bacterium]